MAGDQQFVDYYDVLQVNPNCDAKILEIAYHYLAKIYHPDHSGSTDTSKFNEISEAYRVLRDPEVRAEYDTLHYKHCGSNSFKFAPIDVGAIDENSAIDDAEDHAKILLFLYNKRREDARNAGVVGFYLQDMLNCSHEHFEFHKWYLKEKGYIVLTEQGTLAITIQGVDHVISMSRTMKAEKLLIAQSDKTEE